jgi:hypothetical protein
MHYCMDKIADWGLSNQVSNTCSKCGMEKSRANGKDCCKDKLTYFKITEDQKRTESAILLAHQIATIIPAYPIEFPTHILTLVTPKRPLGNSPGVKHRVPIYIFYCDYRI